MQLEDKQFWEHFNLAKLATLNKKHFAFIGSMLYKLKVSPTSDVRDIFLDTNTSTIKVNPSWFTSLSPEEASAMMAHEVLHYSLQHDIRRGNKIPQLYQKACDEVVNNMLLDFGFKLPMDIVVNRNYQNQNLEHVYKQVLEEHPNQNPDNSGSGGNDLPDYQPQPSTHQQNQRNRDLNQSQMVDKASGGKDIGDSSEAFRHLFKEINEGKINWKQLLAEHFNELTQGEPSYHDLDRRMLSLGLYEPVNENEGSCHRVAVALDVSGSISEEQIHIFLQEIKAIAENLNPEIISVMTFNTGLVDVLEFKQGDDLSQIPLDIGGGTSLEPVFNYYNEPKNEPEFLIVFSDLEVWDFPKKPKYHTTWICFDNPEAEVPFGKLIHVHTEDLQ